MSTTNSIPLANSHFIDLSTAIAMTSTYRSNYESILGSGYKNSGVLALSETFNRAALDAILAQEDCEAVRIYFGMTTGLKVHSIILGVNAENEDILAAVNSLTNEEDVIIELAQRCPDLCPPASALNSKPCQFL